MGKFQREALVPEAEVAGDAAVGGRGEFGAGEETEGVQTVAGGDEDGAVGSVRVEGEGGFEVGGAPLEEAAVFGSIVSSLT